MSACAHDGEGKIVPLAFAIVEIENMENWKYFLVNLRISISQLGEQGIVLMHDREKGLHEAQSSILPTSYKSICVFHLEKNVNSTFKSKFQGKIWAAAKATTVRDFELAMQKLKEMNEDAAAYLRDADPTRWAAALFPTPRFGLTTSNSAESLNSWIEPLRTKSHLSFLAG